MKWKHILAIGLSAAMVMCTVLKEGTIVYANTEMDAISHGGKTFEAAGIQVEDGENPEGAFSDCTSLKKTLKYRTRQIPFQREHLQIALILKLLFYLSLSAVSQRILS